MTTPQIDSEVRRLKKIIDGFVAAMVTLALAIGIILFTLIPAQKERTFYYYARQLGLIIVSQVTRLFPDQYDESDKWRDRAAWFVTTWSNLVNAITTGTQTRRQGDKGE